ncbi:ORF6C domain-containing protein [Paenibacillus vini]|uniref:ORF6C domain-containing protein n=1 Tax=Paenibacillus vini TaxID=1476024 RepID=UPI0025B6D06B|nr:ORF6C domain-containing protein [Paenibacillus vini]MDN4069236.1 ORF6C domain-containing protein [Paenibacillus vini]MDN4069289.1 ORF6C domain-containing protein [Paenibacillus vini]
MSNTEQIYPVEQKLVPFNGAELLGVKANDGKVYVGARWVCDGIGLREGQRNNQLTKIQSDLVLKRGVRKFILPTNSGEQEVTVIELNFLPLWVAKISPNTVEGDVQECLIEYQLKAKDVLSAAFIPDSFRPENISREVRAIFVLDDKIQNLDSRVEHLENHTTIDYGQQQKLKKAGNSKILSFLGGKKTAAYKDRSLRSKTYKALWNDYQEFFEINSYNNTYTKNFERGIQYISRWTPPSNLMREIEATNGQTLF